MLLGIKSKRELLARHARVGFLTALLVSLFWFSRTDLSLDVRLWRALGDTAFSLLFITLAIGPLAKLWKLALRLVPWRRETGIWFAFLAASHFIRVSDYAALEPGIELPRLLGLIALFWALALAATSSDRAVNFLGVSSWKWLHNMAYVIFYLVAGHATYFLFWRYPEANWFQYPFLAMAMSIPILQASAFAKEIIRQRAGKVHTESKKIKLPIVEQKIIAEKTCEVSFDVSGEKFEFSAGQYIRINIPTLLYPDQKGAGRDFSIASSPHDKNKISIAFRDSGSGFKRTLMELPHGSLVDIEGPFGYFTLPPDTSRPLVFIAGGIGITPFLSMIRFVAEKRLNHHITLLYANRNREGAAYLEELTTIDEQNSHSLLKNQFGRIDADFIRQAVKNLDEPVWYIAGPPAMVADMRDVLSRLGVNDARIYFEDFVGY
jgi:ferredoxin-NADP reductase/DMSO/TMAO reductase YedYZ heme-binding membrane subunit